MAEALVWPVGLLVLAPTITHLRSLEAYGTLLLLTAVSGAAPVLMAGTQQVLVQRLAETASPGDDPTVGAAIALAAGAVLLVVLIALAWVLGDPAGTLSLATTGLHRPIFIAACAAAATGAAIDQLSLGILKGLSLFRRSAKLELFSRGLQIGSAAGAAALVGSDLAPSIALGLAYLVGSVIRLVAASRAIAWALPRRPLSSAIGLLRTGWWMLFGSLGGYLYMSLDRVIVGSLLGPRALALYGIGVQLAQFSHMLPAAYFQPMVPATSRLHARGESNGMRQFARRSSLKALMAVSTLAILTALCAPILIVEGLHQPLSAEGLHMLWLCIAASALMGLSVPAYYMLLGMGRFAVASMMPLIAGLAMVGLLILIGPGGSVVQCAAARVLAAVIMMAAFVWVLRSALRAPASTVAPAKSLPQEAA